MKYSIHKWIFAAVLLICLGLLVSIRGFDIGSWLGSVKQAVKSDFAELDRKIDETDKKIKAAAAGGVAEVKVQAQAIEDAVKNASDQAEQKILRAVDQAAGMVNQTAELIGQGLQQGVAQLKQKFLDLIGAPENPYGGTQAVVRAGSDLAPEEKEFLGNRVALVRDRLAQQFGDLALQAAHVPTVAICMSGGGHRAMIASVGFLMGAQESGLLDTTMYLSGLSGSTWAIDPWIASDLSLEQFKNSLRSQVQYHVLSDMTKQSREEIMRAIVTKYIGFGQEITGVDFWGDILANGFFSWAPNKQAVYLSSAASRVKGGSVPLPIATAVSNNIVQSSAYEWFEFTPYEVGCERMQSWVPLWGFGRAFEKGKSVDFAQEQNLGYLIGVFGAALSLGVGDIINQIVSQGELGREFGAAIAKELGSNLEDVRSRRIIPGGIVHNFMYKFAGAPAYAREVKELELKDSGMDGSMSYLPLARKERNVDIIILCDVSDWPVGTALTQINQNALQKGVTVLPDIDPTTVEASTVNYKVFGDPQDLTKQVIIFIPQRKNPKLLTYGNFDPQFAMKKGFSATTNFAYTPENFDALSGYAQESIQLFAPEILEIIKQRAIAKGAAQKVVQ